MFFSTTVLLVAASMMPLHATDLEIMQAVENALKASDLGTTDVSVCILDVSNGAVLGDIDSSEAMIPASNMKLLTSAAGLWQLGPDYEFQTRLEAWPQDSGDSILAIVGGGDPAFLNTDLLTAADLSVDEVFGSWANAITFRRSEWTQLVVDSSCFDSQYIHPEWPADQLHKTYCAPVCGLNIANNLFQAQVTPTLPGELVAVKVFPNCSAVDVRNTAVTGVGDVVMGVVVGRNRINISRSTNSQTINRMPMYQPDMLAANWFEEVFGGYGIDFAQDATLAQNTAWSDANSEVLHGVTTPIADVLHIINEQSNNMYAESVLKMLGYTGTGEAGTTASGLEQMESILVQKLLVDQRVWQPIFAGADGSGLSRNNRVSTRLLCETLRAMEMDINCREIFRNSLASPGEGTVGNRFSRQEMGANLFAKSGYINSVSSFSGYLVYPPSAEGRGERVVAFSIIFNNFNTGLHNGHMKDAQEAIILACDEVLSQRLSVEQQAVPSY